MKPTLTVTTDFTDQFNDIVKRFKRDEVLVGIPESTGARTVEADEPKINNATLLAMNDLGSPANNIPARPVMEIGIKKAQPAIIDAFREAAVGALSQGVSAILPAYNKAGSIAAHSIKKVINDQEGIKGPSEATLRMRKAQGFKGTKALIVTGQMRNAITYVVKGGK